MLALDERDTRLAADTLPEARQPGTFLLERLTPVQQELDVDDVQY